MTNADVFFIVFLSIGDACIAFTTSDRAGVKLLCGMTGEIVKNG
jgi:hypothetical protein